ncbi:MAG: exosortase-associated EpsI family protein [Verrucomicrobia bacterium]|nr:MAG: exosortase-associated EpsI family protein [Verrucomicrobiota bacterium]
MKTLLLPIALGLGLAGIYFLPTAGKVGQSAVNMTLSDSLDQWQMNKIPPTEAEILTLSKDTEFAKAVCLAPRPGEFTLDGMRVPDRVDLSVVLSGADLNNSIHRPERCMPAQGHTILSSTGLTIESKGKHLLPVRRLKSVQRVPTNAEHTEYSEFPCLTYYFFVGHSRVTDDHLKRTIYDMKDRLLRGMDQRWAYISVTMAYGKIPWIEAEVSEQEADEKLQNFIRSFADEQIRWEEIDS